jgi:hypothetical protein
VEKVGQFLYFHSLNGNSQPYFLLWSFLCNEATKNACIESEKIWHLLYETPELWELVFGKANSKKTIDTLAHLYVHVLPYLMVKLNFDSLDTIQATLLGLKHRVS